VRRWFQLSDYLHAVATPEGLKLLDVLVELVERPPISVFLEVHLGAYQEGAAPALRIPQDGQPAHADTYQQQDTCQYPGTWQARKDQEDV
jgi:hypothetical protein